MTAMEIIVDPELVNRFLKDKGLEQGYCPIAAACLQPGGTANGKPAVLLAIDCGGELLIAKTTLALMEAAVRALRAGAGDER